MKVVLASGSKWRKQVLEDAGVSCEAVASGVDERAIQIADPTCLARTLARLKAQAVAARRPDALVIGADQVAHLKGECFGKPADSDDHLRRLKQLRGRSHELVTGVCVVSPGGEEEIVDVTTRVHFRGDLSDGDLRAYVATGEGAGSAGGYEAEHRGAFLIERIEGDWFNVIGLPLYTLIPMLSRRGWSPWT